MKRRNNYAIQRYLVKDVFEGDYVNGKGYKEFEKVVWLLVQLMHTS